MYAPPPSPQRAKRSGLAGYGVAPAVAVGVAAKGVGTIKRIFKTPAHKRAAKEGPAMVRAAIAGDSAALAELLRLSQQAATTKAKGVWRKFYEQAIAGGAGRVAAPTATAPPPITTPQVSPPVTTVTPAGPVVTSAVPAPTYTYTPPPSAAAPEIPGVTPEAEATGTEQPPAKAGMGNLGLLAAGGLALFFLMPKGRRR